MRTPGPSSRRPPSAPVLATVLLALVTPPMTIAASSSPASGAAPQPPVAERIPHVTTLNGDRRTDDYYWLRDKKNPKVVAYLEAENAYTDAMTGDSKAFQDQLYQEMLARIQQTDLTVPYRKGECYWYSRTEEGKQYPIYCRKQGTLDAPEQVVLDLNELAASHPFMALGDYEASPDGTLLAYTTDSTGFRQYALHVKNLATGETLPDHADRVTSLAWASDGRTLFYSQEDEVSKRSWIVYRHVLGAAKDEPAYEEKDERFDVGVERSRSGEWLFMTVSSHTTSEVRCLPADQPHGRWILIAPRRQDVEYYVDHRAGEFWIRTNDTGRNFRVVTAPTATPDAGHWTEVLTHRPAVMVTALECFKDAVVLGERERALPQITLLDPVTRAARRVQFPEAAYAVGPAANEQFDTHEFRYGYQSFVTPPSVYDLDVASLASTLLKRQQVLGGWDPSRYAIERIEATAKDGVRVPITLVYRKELKRDGSAPCLLYGYGSYGIPSNVTFNSNRFSLVDRGFVYALAHIRGGGDLGKAWHDNGRMMKKMNTFTDFIACGEKLVADRYTSQDRLVIQGGSAGGLLMGAVTNLRPDLWKGVLAQVPFVDVLNTMLDESLPLTVGEFEEWGNPKRPAEYTVMKQYSPYDNLERKSYPAMLVKTSLNDSQVMYWEPAKYVAKLRTLRTDSNPLLLKINMGAGHGGASGRYDALRDIAFDYAWVLETVGMPEAKPLP